MFYVVPGKEKKKRNSADCGDESQSAALRKPKIRKRRRGVFFLKKEDARYVHIMLSSGICNFKAASTRESRVTIFKVITQMSYEWYLLFEHIF